MECNLQEQQFNELASQGYNRIPITLETFADLDTPLSIYLKLANTPWSYLLESVVSGEQFGRYSFIGLSATTRIEVYDRKVLVLSENRVLERRDYGDPLNFIDEYLDRIRVPNLENLPRFVGGLVGYFGYDTVRYIEPSLSKTVKEDELGLPDILLMLSEELAIIDNLTGKLTFVIYAEPDVPNAYKRAKKRLSELLGKLRKSVEIPQDKPSTRHQIHSSFSKEQHMAAVEKIQQYVMQGDLMQVGLSRRIHCEFTAEPLALYRAIRTINPSPYMFYYHFDDFQIVGASPEILLRLTQEQDQKRTMTVRPIAGTRPRGKTEQEDINLEQELRHDEKEVSEHTQLLDLGRNDIGKVAKVGTVEVSDMYTIERYSHVMHLVSNVQAQLDEKYSPIDAFRSVFPAGTIAGAPKLRAMQIIDELEPVKRGIYSGAAGYIGFQGNIDMAIAIRTAVIKDNQVYIQVGGGIVADSDPEKEWQETENKAHAMLKAVEICEKGLDS